jgi:signal transduction histidine kinase
MSDPGLRVKLVLPIAVVVCATLAAVAVFSSRATRLEFHRLEDVRARRLPRDLSRERAALEQHFARSKGWSGVEPLLASLSTASGQELVLVDPGGRAAAVAPGLAGATVEPMPLGGIRIRRAAHGLVREILLQGSGLTDLRGPDGSLAGRLAGVASAETMLSEESSLVSGVNRRLAWAVSIAGLFALAATALVARAILKPVESLTGAALKMERGDLSARVAPAGRDELGRLAHAFNSMAASLERSETARRNMVADVAHELRTPLTNLRCQVEAMRDGLVPADAEAVRSLEDEVLLLARLVDDLQELALADAGALSLDLQAIRAADVARGACAAMQPVAAAAGVRLENALDSDGTCVDVDPERLGQILRNLLANAIRHTPAGGRVELAVQRAGNRLELAVSDTGCGIPAEDLPRVFDRFHRVDGSRSRATGGAGLGLAIARQLAAAQGGEIRAESEPGRGSRFVVSLPIPPS